MSVALDIFGLPALVSLIVALLVAYGGRRGLSVSATERYVLPAALAAGFFSGYLVLPRDSAPLFPDQPWHCLPYLGVAAAAISAAARLSNRAIVGRFLLLAAALLAALLLAPSWPIFILSRWSVVAIIGVYVLALLLSLDTLPTRLLGPRFAGLAAVVAIVLALAIGLFISVRLAQLAAMAAGTFAGLWIACLMPPSMRDLSMRAAVPLYVMLIGGVAIVGCVEPDPPLLWLIAMPLAPLTLWGFAAAGWRQR